MNNDPTFLQLGKKALFPSAQKYWHLLVITVGLSLAGSVFEVFSIGMLIPFLQTFSDGAGGFWESGIYWIDTYILGVDASRIERMYRICGIILFATWMRSVTGYFSSVYHTITRARIIADVRQRVVNRLTEVALSFYSTTRDGAVLNSVTTEVSRMAAALNVIFVYVMRGTLLIGYAAIMVWISWKLSLIALLVFVVLSVGLTRIVRSLEGLGREVSDANEDFTARVSEFLESVRTVVAYNMQDIERRGLHRAADRSADSVIDTSRRNSLIQPISQAVVSSVLIILVVVAVQFFVLEGELNMAFLLTFLFALFRMTPIIHQLNNERGTWAQNKAGIMKVAELLNEGDKPYISEGPRTAHSLQESIQFEDVYFSYEPGKPVLKDINLSIEHGKTTALVGASGAGKSTLVDLVPRFHDPDRGTIFYDGVDLREFNTRSLRDQIAIVSQSAHIFNDTVRNNITYGDPDASFEQIYEAARQANALTFIEDLDQGFDAPLGNRGVLLSGGQRQRIAIARAILQDPEILILDEATSDLDSISEKLVQQSMENLMEGRTVIAIAHRLSTIKNADWVAVLENGRIVEQGHYQELLERRGQLWKYHSIQFQMA